MDTKILLSIFLVAVVSFITGIMFYDSSRSQSELEYQGGWGANHIQVVVFTNDIEDAKALFYNSYKRFEILYYELHNGMIVITAQKF